MITLEYLVRRLNEITITGKISRGREVCGDIILRTVEFVDKTKIYHAVYDVFEFDCFMGHHAVVEYIQPKQAYTRWKGNMNI